MLKAFGGMKLVLASVLFGALAMVSAMGAKPALASHSEDDDVPRINQIRKQIEASPLGALHVVGTVTINDATQEEVFNFISDLENDTQWYPGTLSSQKLSGDGGPGTKYQETVYFFDQQIPVVATVLKVKPNKSFWFTSDGVFTNLTNYRVSKEKKGKVKFTLDSTVEATNGVTEEFFGQYLTLTFQNLLTAMGKTGTIVIE